MSLVSKYSSLSATNGHATVIITPRLPHSDAQFVFVTSKFCLC